MKRACVVGWPIAHSRSPLIHSYWLKLYGIDGVYTREPVGSDDLPRFIGSLGERGFAGCNVTVPHKEAAFALAAIRDSSARAVAAANTLWIEDGKLACANTDTYGFMTNLTVCAPQWANSDGPIAVLGSGGSARAVVHGFLEAGRQDIRIYNRSLLRAQNLARHFGSDVSAHTWVERNDGLESAALIVNTTTLGMNQLGDPDIDFQRAAKSCVAADLVYAPLKTSFLKAAEAHGLSTVGGLGMLLHQAVPGFEKWFGVRPEVTAELVTLVEDDVGRV